MQQFRIVIADDDHNARAGLRAFLSSVLGCDIVSEATDGAETIAHTARYHPDVVVLDVRMPRIDGLQATRTIKARWPHTAVVALTLYADLRASALAAGADAFVAKGDAPERLIQILRRIHSSAGEGPADSDRALA